MIQTNKLKGVIVANGLTMADVANELNVTPKTFYEKMKKGVFGTDEAEKMIKLLKIENPGEIFFGN